MNVGELRRKPETYPDEAPVRILDFSGGLGDAVIEHKPCAGSTSCVLEMGAHPGAGRGVGRGRRRGPSSKNAGGGRWSENLTRCPPAQPPSVMQAEGGTGVMDEQTLDWKGSAKLLLEAGRFEHPAELGEPPAATPARPDRCWTLGGARQLWRAVLRLVSDEGGVPKESPARALWDTALRAECWRTDGGAVMVQQVALRCTGLPGMDQLDANTDARAAAEALKKHHGTLMQQTGGGE